MKLHTSFALFLFAFVSCSSPQKSFQHDPSNIVILKNGQYVLGSYSKSHDINLLIGDLAKENIHSDKPITINAEFGTPHKTVNAVISELRNAGYQDIKLGKTIAKSAEQGAAANP